MTVIFAGCGKKAEDFYDITITRDELQTDYEMAEVKRGDVVKSVNISCVYKEESGEELSFGVDGRRVEEVFVEVGDTVKKGQMLAKLECSEYEQEKAYYEYVISKNKQLAQNAYELYDFDCAELKKDYEKGGMIYSDYQNRIAILARDTNEQVEDYTDAISVASIKLSEVNEKLKGCLICAGMDGTVSFISNTIINGENRYTKDVAVIRVIDKASCVFMASMKDVKDYAEYFTPGEVMTLYNSNGFSVDAIVKEYQPEDENIILELTELNEDLKVGNKLFVNLMLDEAKDVLCLPNSAVHKADDKYYVYVSGEGGLKALQYVTVGVVGNQFVEIKDGLSEGEIVIKK